VLLADCVSDFNQVSVTCKDRNTGGSMDSSYAGGIVHTAHDIPPTEIDCYNCSASAIHMQYSS